MKYNFHINLFLKKIPIYYYLGFFCLITAIVSILFALNNINYFQIDFGGHIASTAMFQKFGLHSWNPNRFHGLINNLFYPPLEDIIVFIIHALTTFSQLNSFMVYISLLIFGYWFAAYLIIRQIKNKSVAVLLFLGLFIFFFLDKTSSIIYFQGGGFFDLLFTGLTSQSLGIVFMLLFLSHFIKDNPTPYYLAFFSSLAFLSHLIIGPVLFLVWFLYIIYTKNKKHILFFFLSLAIASVFWLPFIAFSSLAIPSLIVFNAPILFLAVICFLFFIAYKKKFIPSMLLLFVAILIISPNYISNFWELLTNSPLNLPLFHYYRFASLSLLLSIVAVASLLDRFYLYHIYSPIKRTYFLGGTTIGSILLLLLFFHFGVVSFSQMKSALNTETPSQQYTDLDKIQKTYGVINNGKKILTLDAYRPIGFGIDSYFQYETPGLPFVKGLFWESSKSNQLLSSYLSTLFSPKDIVLDHYVMPILNQTHYNNFFDGFIRQYNIGWLIVAPKDKLHYLTGSISTMMFTTFSSGTNHYQIKTKDTIYIHGLLYTLYQIIPRDSDLEYGFLRPFTKESTPTLLFNDRYFADQIFSFHNDSTKSLPFFDNIYFDLDNIPNRLIPFWSSSQEPIYTKISQDSYRIDLGSTPQSVVVRLPDLPGWSIKGGENISIYNGVFEKIITGSGVVILSYDKPSIIIFSYFLSLLSSVFLLYFTFKKQ